MDDSKLAKVRKLLAKAENPACSPAEAEALTAKAAELIASYGIDAAMLAVEEPARDKVVDKQIACLPPFAESKVSLLFAVAEPLRVRAILLKTRQYDGVNRYRYEVHLFGFSADIERAELLYTSLLLQAANAMQHTAVPAGRDKAAFRESWLEGFASAIRRRLRAAEKQAETGAGSDGKSSVALVLADRSVQVEQAFNAAYPDVVMGKARNLSGGGRSAGYEAGQRADLGGTHVGGRKAPALQ